MIKLQSFPFQAPNRRPEIPEPHQCIATSKPHHCHIKTTPFSHQNHTIATPLPRHCQIKTFSYHIETAPLPDRNLSLHIKTTPLPDQNLFSTLIPHNLDTIYNSIPFSTVQLHDLTIYINIEERVKV